jgi:hypothetical protein
MEAVGSPRLPFLTLSRLAGGGTGVNGGVNWVLVPNLEPVPGYLGPAEGKRRQNANSSLSPSRNSPPCERIGHLREYSRIAVSVPISFTESVTICIPGIFVGDS